jgi:hypothetical protein
VYADVAATEVGVAGREQVQRDHRHAEADDVLPAVPLLVRQHRRPPIQPVTRTPGHDDVADGEGGSGGDAQPVAGGEHQPARAALDATAAESGDRETQTRRTVDRVQHLLDPPSPHQPIVPGDAANPLCPDDAARRRETEPSRIMDRKCTC